MLNKLWKDEDGIVALEYLLIATVLGLALIVGFSNLASALNVEFTELSTAILTLDQGYAYQAASGCAGSHAGATVTDSSAAATYGETTNVNTAVSTGSLTLGCP